MINHPNAAMNAAESRGRELLNDAERLARAESAFRQAISDPNGLPFGSRWFRRTVRLPLALKANPHRATSPQGPIVRSPRPRLSGSRLLARADALRLDAERTLPLATGTRPAGKGLE